MQAINLKVPKFLDAKKLCCNLPKIQTKRPNLLVFRQNDANGIANSEDPDQTEVQKLRIITVDSSHLRMIYVLGKQMLKYIWI